jgi:hypothetical protein
MMIQAHILGHAVVLLCQTKPLVYPLPLPPTPSPLPSPRTIPFPQLSPRVIPLLAYVLRDNCRVILCDRCIVVQ